jgi:peptide/nickel transport system permease protein
MSKNKVTEKNMEQEVPTNMAENEEMHLDDARRVKVLSPGMLVFKRFIRNSLAVIGFGILTFMFIFAFVGPLFSPYGQTQVFSGVGTMSKDFAGATYNQELRYSVAEGQEFDSAARAKFLLAKGKNEQVFSSGDTYYYYVEEDENTYRIMVLNPVVEVMLGNYRPVGGFAITPEFVSAYEAALASNLGYFNYGGITYRITQDKKSAQISIEDDIALATLDVFDAYNQDDAPVVTSFAFKIACAQVIAENETTFVFNDRNYTIEYGEAQTTIYDDAGNNFAEISDIIVNPLDKEIFLSVDFKRVAREAINNKADEFTYTDENGQTIEYSIDLVNTIYNIKTTTPTELIRQYEAPSLEHPLGLDNNGMDLMTRLMFGGRVSLMVGFVVVFLEVMLGVLVGGISGYFGKWVDTALMRFVDLFNSIPFYPMVLIFGSVMDALEVKPMARIFSLMVILGLLGWTGVARIVRGQILSLREQDFMVATEATGIRTSRRIFKHLVPNVMPLLIVYATAGLGEVIIAEATLGFLGLGVKYPLASWGSIINVASDAFVMTNYWFMWIPAGLLILLTVLGFNFVGDGLRDAYDPKMKR